MHEGSVTTSTICSQLAFTFDFLDKPLYTLATADTHLHNTGQNNKTCVYLNAKSENRVQGDSVELWPVDGSVSSALHVRCSCVVPIVLY